MRATHKRRPLVVRHAPYRIPPANASSRQRRNIGNHPSQFGQFAVLAVGSDIDDADLDREVVAGLPGGQGGREVRSADVVNVDLLLPIGKRAGGAWKAGFRSPPAPSPVPQRDPPGVGRRLAAVAVEVADVVEQCAAVPRLLALSGPMVVT